MSLPIQLRDATAGDRDFLYQVFAAAGPALELQYLPESPLRSQLIRTQFDGWRAGYSAKYGAGGLKIIEASAVPSGYVWLYEAEGEQRIVDLAFAPDARGKGLGTALINMLVSAAHAAGKPMRASVAKSNDGSLRFNLRSGAVITGETATHWAIEWPLG